MQRDARFGFLPSLDPFKPTSMSTTVVCQAKILICEHGWEALLVVAELGTKKAKGPNHAVIFTKLQDLAIIRDRKKSEPLNLVVSPGFLFWNQYFFEVKKGRAQVPTIAAKRQKQLSLLTSRFGHFQRS
eukprot:6205773-Pleurochrysis_carterae.AAC.1